MKHNPKVSIIVISYNQEKYIRDALESFVFQKSDFPYEVIVGDDNSKDKTPNIIKEYADKYPDIIRPILRDKNLGAWQNFTDTIKRAKGEYIALCEGDDYWTDENKLQKQVEFLDKNPDFVLCFHPVVMKFEDSGEEKLFPDPSFRANFTTRKLIERNFIHTNSVMYRRQNYEGLAKDVMPGDWYLHLFHARFGRIGYLKETMSVYRRHPGGIWWNADKNIDEIWKKYGIPHLKMYYEILQLYKETPLLRGIVMDHIYKMLTLFVGVDAKCNVQLIKESFELYPEFLEGFIAYQNNEFKKVKSQYDEAVKYIEGTDAHIAELEHELLLIESSRVWKARNKIAKGLGK